jgi:hypothetical protein
MFINFCAGGGGGGNFYDLLAAQPRRDEVKNASVIGGAWVPYLWNSSYDGLCRRD